MAGIEGSGREGRDRREKGEKGQSRDHHRGRDIPHCHTHHWGREGPGVWGSAGKAGRKQAGRSKKAGGARWHGAQAVGKAGRQVGAGVAVCMGRWQVAGGSACGKG